MCRCCINRILHKMLRIHCGYSWPFCNSAGSRILLIHVGMLSFWSSLIITHRIPDSVMFCVFFRESAERVFELFVEIGRPASDDGKGENVHQGRYQDRPCKNQSLFSCTIWGLHSRHSMLCYRVRLAQSVACPPLAR